MKKENKIKKAGVYTAIIIAVALMNVYITATIVTNSSVEEVIDVPTLLGVDGGNDGDVDGDGYLEDWYEVDRITAKDVFLSSLGEYSPVGDESCWLSCWHLDYGQTPETVLANNATDWSADANSDGYIDADNQETDLDALNLAYVCARARHNDTAKEGGTWNHSRFRMKMTITGDESIAGVYEYNNSGTSGDMVVSAETTNYLYATYFWDDGVDGYQIQMDGALYWAIILEERY